MSVSLAILLVCFWVLLSNSRNAYSRDKHMEPGSQTMAFVVNGLERNCIVHVPAAYRLQKPLPLVIMLHGGGGTARAAMWETQWAEKADQEGFLAVFPNAMARDPARRSSFARNPQLWNDGSDRFYAGQEAVDDVGFIAALLDELALRFTLDKERIFLTGFSNGASMSFRVGAELSDRIAAIAPVAGALWFEPTRLRHPVSMLYITGTEDPLNLIAGGVPKLAMGASDKVRAKPKPPVRDSILKWAKALGCPGTPASISDVDGVRTETYSLCTGNAEVVYTTVAGMGHTWAGGRSLLPERVVGKTSDKIRATDVIWEFFCKHAPSIANSHAAQHAAPKAAQAGPGADAPKQLDFTPERFPALEIAGDDVSRYANGQPARFRGFADPCIRRDPLSNDLWLAYSWPHMEQLGKDQRNFVVGVETHLALSKDGGNSWRRMHVLWKKAAARFTDRRKGIARDGFISHEVPNILPCTVDGIPSWIGARLDYFLGREGNYKDRDNLSFCLRVMASATPPGLANAPFVTFGHDGSSPECEVDVNLCRLSKDFPPVFIPNEPALCFKDNRLYLAFVVMTFQDQSPDFPKSFIAVLSTAPQGAIRSWQWRYHGKLATYKEAKELGGESLTQIELALGRDGQLLAFLVPESWNAKAAAKRGRDAFFGIRHHGCAVVEVASLETPALARRKDGRLAIRAFLDSSFRSEHGPGAAAYDSGSATGVLFTLRDIASSSNLSWSLHPTGMQL